MLAGHGLTITVAHVSQHRVNATVPILDGTSPAMQAAGANQAVAVSNQALVVDWRPAAEAIQFSGRGNSSRLR